MIQPHNCCSFSSCERALGGPGESQIPPPGLMVAWKVFRPPRPPTSALGRLYGALLLQEVATLRKGSHRAALRATAVLGTSLLLVLGPAPAAQTVPLRGAHAQVAQPLRRGRPLPCRPAQLVADYLGGEGATQQLFGWFVLRDISLVSCSFSDLLMFAGLNASGRVVTTVLHPRLSVGGLILTPRAPIPPQGAGLPAWRG